MCGQTAKFFYKALELEGEFNASIGWLTRFKQQYGILEIAVQGERLSASDAAANMFCMELKKFVQEENLKLDKYKIPMSMDDTRKAFQQEPLCLKDRSMLPVIN
jgi:hypothetical protein